MPLYTSGLFARRHEGLFSVSKAALCSDYRESSWDHESLWCMTDNTLFFFVDILPNIQRYCLGLGSNLQ